MAQSKEDKYKRSSEYRKENKEKVSLRESVYYTKNKESIAAKEKLYKENNKESIAIKAIAAKYNVSFDSALDLYKRSIMSCESCRIPWDGGRRLCVDHNHTTGEVRGLLCGPCNSSLGLLKEDDSKILALLDYNRKYNG